MILLTTSRRPTRSIRTFCKDLSHTIPNIIRINRGKLSLEGLAAKALELNAEKVVVINRWKGGPGKIELYLLNETGLCLTSPLIYLRGVKLRREFGNMPRGRRIKFMAMLTSPKCLEEVSKLEKTLSMFFNVPIIRAIDECKTLDAVMQVTASQTKELTVTFRLLPENIEIGPRMRISHLIWDLTHES